MKHPRFTVVTGILTFLVAVGAATRVLKPFLPPPAANELLDARDDFLRQAGRQPIDWRPNLVGAFHKARTERRPVFFLVGTPWSGLARRLDTQVFQNQDVARYLGRNFVCVRVDAAADRKWLSAFLPYTRLARGILPGIQAWILDENGRTLDLIGRSRADQGFDPDQFLSILVEATESIRTGPGGSRPGSDQEADLALLRKSPTRAFPDPLAFADQLALATDAVYGGYPRHGLQPLLPDAWRFQVFAGRTEDARLAVDPILYSGLYDVIDGGFFRLCANDFGRRVEFGKLAADNASAAWSLALLEWATGDPTYRVFAQGAFDSVLSDLQSGGFIATCRVGSAERDGRSPRHSFGSARLSRIFGNDDRALAATLLGLVPGENIQMIPHFVTPAGLETNSPHTRRLLSVLRENAAPPDPLAGKDSAEAHCFSAARLLEAGRVWGDPERLALAEQMVRTGQAFAPNGIVSARAAGELPSDYLGDWLAYADLSLQDFLAFGRSTSLRAGAKALDEALRRFKGRVPGEYLVSRQDVGEFGPKNFASPEVADNAQESCTGRVIRLGTAYGALYGETPRGRSWSRQAAEAVRQYADVLQQAGPSSAGYHAAALIAGRSAVAFAVGPDAVLRANDLFRSAPTALVAPAVGDVRPDLQGRTPGYYVVGPDGAAGPLSLGEAARRLAPRGASHRPGAS